MFSSAGFQFFKSEFQLFDLALNLLRPAPELCPSQLGDLQHQMLDLTLVGDELYLCAMTSAFNAAGSRVSSSSKVMGAITIAEVCHNL